MKSPQPLAGTKRQRPSSPRHYSSPKRRKSESSEQSGIERHKQHVSVEKPAQDPTSILTNVSFEVVDRLSVASIEFLSNCSIEQLSQIAGQHEDDLTRQWAHWYQTLMNGAQCAGILTNRGGFTSKAIEDMHRSHIRRKQATIIIMAAAVTLDIARLQAMHEDMADFFVGSDGAVSDSQADLLLSIIACLNDKSINDSSVPLFVDDGFMPRLEDRLRQATRPKGCEALDGGAQRFFDRCAQTRTEWLQLEVQGKLDGVEARNKSAMITAVHNHLLYIMEAYRTETLDGPYFQGINSAAADEGDILETEEVVIQEVAQPSTINDNDDLNFNEFLERQQKAMQAAMQGFDQDDETAEPVDRPEENSTPTQENDCAEQHASSILIHQPTPIAAPARLAASNLTTTADKASPVSPTVEPNGNRANPIRSNVAVNATKPPSLRASYDSARLAAHTRALQKKRPPSPANPSNRKIWSTEEENALLDGLDYVRGPHWRDILALYGESGIKGDVLRSRSQVQLKDKARNMKLFYVKNGYEIPEILRNVTGELKGAKGKTDGVAEDAGDERTIEETETGMADARAPAQSERGVNRVDTLVNGNVASEEMEGTLPSGDTALAELAATIVT